STMKADRKAGSAYAARDAGGTGERVAREPWPSAGQRARDQAGGAGKAGERAAPTGLRPQGPLPLGQDPRHGRGRRDLGTRGHWNGVNCPSFTVITNVGCFTSCSGVNVNAPSGVARSRTASS